VAAPVAAALVAVELLATEYVLFATQYLRRYAGHGHDWTPERDLPWTLLEAQPGRAAPLVAMFAAAALLLWRHRAQGGSRPTRATGARGLVSAVSLLLVPAATVVALELERARDPLGWDSRGNYVTPLPQCWILLCGAVGVAVTYGLAVAIARRSPDLSSRSARLLVLGYCAAVLPWCVGVGGYALGWLALDPSREEYAIEVLYVVRNTGLWLFASSVVAGLALIGVVLCWLGHDTKLATTAVRRVVLGCASVAVGGGASFVAWPYALENAHPFPYALDHRRVLGNFVRGHGPDGPLPIGRVTGAAIARAERELARRPRILLSSARSLLLDGVPFGDLRVFEALEKHGVVPNDSELVLTLRQRPAAEVWLALDRDWNLAWRNVLRQLIKAGVRRCALLAWHEEVLARPVMGHSPFGYWTLAHFDLVPVTGAAREPTLARFADHDALVEYVVAERRRGRMPVLALPPLEGPGRATDR
jgi:hypothetical protein